MKYPVKVTLRKIHTLEDAEYPQREKYPDGTERQGLMWEFSRPHVGLPFTVLKSKLLPTFRTSTVTEILEVMDHRIVFKTFNSTYALLIEEIPE